MSSDENFKKGVLEAFKRIKADFSALESRQDKEVQEIKRILAQIELRLKNFEDKPYSRHPMISSGESINQSITQASLTQIKQQLSQKFENLRKKELAVYLTIYQLEDDLAKDITHAELSKELNITEDAIRGYISRILQRGIPLTRKKVNNRITVLSIPTEIRDLNLKKRLLDLYYTQDPTQRTLFDTT